MKESISSRYYLISLALGFLAVSTMLVGKNSNIECAFTINQTEWKECTAEMKTICSESAFSEDNSFLFDQVGSVKMVCPWNTQIYTMNSISLMVSVFFLTFLLFAPKIKSFHLGKFLLLAGLLASLCLLITGGSMIYEVAVRYSSGKISRQSELELKYIITPFFLNAVLMVSAFITMVLTTIYGFKAHRKVPIELLLSLNYHVYTY